MKSSRRRGPCWPGILPTRSNNPGRGCGVVAAAELSKSGIAPTATSAAEPFTFTYFRIDHGPEVARCSAGTRRMDHVEGRHRLRPATALSRIPPDSRCQPRRGIVRQDMRCLRRSWSWPVNSKCSPASCEIRRAVPNVLGRVAGTSSVFAAGVKGGDSRQFASIAAVP
jgi:hypothetical protein